jgi:acyl carrier protein
VQLEDLVASVLEIPVSTLKDSSGPATLRAWSSLKHIQLVAALETVYRTTFTAFEVSRLTSVAAVRRILLQKGIALYQD